MSVSMKNMIIDLIVSELMLFICALQKKKWKVQDKGSLPLPLYKSMPPFTSELAPCHPAWKANMMIFRLLEKDPIVILWIILQMCNS